MSKQKENHSNVFQVFKIELKNRFELDKQVNCMQMYLCRKLLISFRFTIEHCVHLLFMLKVLGKHIYAPLIVSNKSIAMWMYMYVYVCGYVYLCVHMYICVCVGICACRQVWECMNVCITC